MLKITTWNVNSIRARMDRLTKWIERNQPSFICLQETKAQDQDFPLEEISQLGYNSYTYGQKTYNGVSIHTKSAIKDVLYGLPDENMNLQKRVITIDTGMFYLVNVYVPQGEDTESEKFRYKLEFLEHLGNYVKKLLETREVVITGDFNIAADERDLYNAELFRGKVMFHPLEHNFFNKLRETGMHDSLRLYTQESGQYSWWDYRGGSVSQNFGIRLDYIWISQGLKDCCKKAVISAEERKKFKPSDHVPYSIELEL